ncbi:MAG: ester cyclase [Hyphomonas sp.]
MPLPITHVATTDISDMMSPGPERRMELPGFAAEFVDFPHYIIRITERIWHDRAVDLCLDWYAPDCVIHTLGGDITGAQTVVDNTLATLKAFPDRRLDADNVIWSDEGNGTFYSSHLITSKMTNEGDSDFGPATGKKVRVRTIADCVCRENRIIEEWLVRDNLAIANQLGVDAGHLAARQAATDQALGNELETLHRASHARILEASSAAESLNEAQSVAAAALETLWCMRDPGRLASLYDYRVSAAYPGAAGLYGPDQVSDWMAHVLTAFPDARLRIDHVADIAYLGDARDVAIRWAVAATHTGPGRYGPATGAPVWILGISHFRIMRGRVREDVCIWDDIALRRQIEFARLRQVHGSCQS